MTAKAGTRSEQGRVDDFARHTPTERHHLATGDADSAKPHEADIAYGLPGGLFDDGNGVGTGHLKIEEMLRRAIVSQGTA